MKYRLTLYLLIVIFPISYGVNGQEQNISEDVSQTLTNLGLQSDQGTYQVLQEDSLILDMSNENNFRRWEILADAQYNNFVLQARFILDADATDDECGFMFRRSDDENYYAITFDRDNSVFFYENFRASPLWQYGSGGDIKSERSNENILTIVVSESQFYVYINHIFAARFQDTSIPTGTLGVTSATWDDGIISRCIINNMWVWQPNISAISMEELPQVASINDNVKTIVQENNLAMKGSLVYNWNYHNIDLTGEDDYLSWEYFGGSYSNYIAQTVIEWGQGDTEDSCGFVIHAVDDANFTVLNINRLGKLKFQPKISGEFLDSHYENVSAIQTSDATRNVLTIMVLESKLSVYINNLEVADFDIPNATAGEIGLLAETGNNSNETSCTFKHSWLWDLNQVAAPQIVSPADGYINPNFPRLLHLEWQSVQGASYYIIETEYSSYDDEWHSDQYINVYDTFYESGFLGAQPGRWRVWAIMQDGSESEKSAWHTFAFDL